MVVSVTAKVTRSGRSRQGAVPSTKPRNTCQVMLVPSVDCRRLMVREAAISMRRACSSTISLVLRSRVALRAWMANCALSHTTRRPSRRR